MKHIVDKLRAEEVRIAQEKGEFNLFALFLREDAPNRWDLLVAADWIDRDKYNAIKYIASRLQGVLSKNEIVLLSKIVVIDEDNPELANLNAAFQVENGSLELRNSDLFGLHINHAYLITSKCREQV